VGGGATWASAGSHAPTKVVIVPGTKSQNAVGLLGSKNTVKIDPAHNTVGITPLHNTVKLDPSHDTVGITPLHNTVKVAPTNNALVSGVNGTAGGQETTVSSHQAEEVDFYDTSGLSAIRVTVSALTTPVAGTPCDLTVRIEAESSSPDSNGIFGVIDSFAVANALGVSKQYATPGQATAIFVTNNGASSCKVGWVMNGLAD
jgi:hypothetical protein